MKIYTYKDLNKQEIELLCSRGLADDFEVNLKAKEIITAVKQEGDAALIRFAALFDKAKNTQLFLDAAALNTIASGIAPTLQNAIDAAAENIRKFHLSQVNKEAVVTTMPGVNCWRESRAIERVGLYVPGGTAVLPSTFLMLAIPAIIAGCKELVICTPPNSEGTVNPAIAYCAVSLGIKKIFLTGGAQAIGAMAYGTATVPKVDKIFGPGNRYVTAAKSLVQAFTAIDMPAGPSEVLVIADETGNPAYVAADLLAQAEHGADSQAVLVATSNAILEAVKLELELQLPLLPRKEIATAALENSFFILTESLNAAIDFSNTYAPEHLILATNNYAEITAKITNAGSVFLGNLTPESAGDYASGTNHTLPTAGFAKSYSGVSVDSFVKKITFQHLTKEGLNNIGNIVEVLAEAEGLQAHKNAITIRLNNDRH